MLWSQLGNILPLSSKPTFITSALMGCTLRTLFLCSELHIRFVTRGSGRDNVGRSSFPSWFRSFSLFLFLLLRHSQRPLHQPPTQSMQSLWKYWPLPSQQPLAMALPARTPSPYPARKVTLTTPTASEHLPCRGVSSACPAAVDQSWLRQPREQPQPGRLQTCPPFQPDGPLSWQEGSLSSCASLGCSFSALGYSSDFSFHFPNYAYVIISSPL